MNTSSSQLSYLFSIAQEIALQMYDRYPPRGPLDRPKGYARGIDYYRKNDFTKVIANILLVYKRSGGGRYPNLIRPVLYSEKLNALKLLAWMKIPESGNKLLTSSFIPPEIRQKLITPRIIWRSSKSMLPANDIIPSGDYFLKANHGSGFLRRIRYPLDHEARSALEQISSRWLQRSFGLELGEWWYNVFEKAIFLEPSVTNQHPSATLHFFTFRGRVRLISIEQKSIDGPGDTRVNVLDPSFRILQNQVPGTQRVTNFSVPESAKAVLIELAEAVGRQFEAVRVDFILGDDGQIYLNEVTFTSDAGKPDPDRQCDLDLGLAWGDCSFLKGF